MKKILRRSLCCLLSILIVFGTTISAFAEVEDSGTTPVVIVNDIGYNPIRNTDDGSVVFDFTDYEVDLLFTSGFSSEITDLFSPEIIESITNGDMETLDIVMLLVDYLGFGGDINNIVNKLLELVMDLMGSIDADNIDIDAIISSIDFKKYAEDIKNSIAKEIEDAKMLKMNNDGTPAYSNIGAVVYSESLEYYYDEDSELADSISGSIGDIIAENIGYENTYVFTYDWRLDPAVNAELLASFINDVKDSAGAENVSVISEGYGSLIATEYLAEYPDDAAESVKNFVTVSSEFLGTSLVGDFFKGDVANGGLTTLNSYTSAYLRYMNDLSDNPITAFAMWLVNYILNTEWELQGFCREVGNVISDANFILNVTGITEQLSYMSGLWALVPVEDYDDAYNNLFDGSENDELADKIDAFKANQESYEDILLDAQDNGINISIVASWDLQIVPIGNNNSVQSDGIVDTSYASFGATCIDLNDVAYAMKAEQMYDDGHDHLSTNYDMLTPWYAYGGICAYIDASSCALPENTWFIKSMKHGSFSYDSNSADFLIWLITADSQRTVWENSAYKQFMNYNRFINPGIISSDGVLQPDDNTQGGYLLGDVNLDGIITAIDAHLAYRMALGLEDIDEDSIPFKNADIDGDGEITLDDAQRILYISSGIDESMTAGIKLDYDVESSGITKSEYNIEIRPVYNSATNKLELTVVLLDAVGSYCGNFIIKYDSAMFNYSSAKTFDISNGGTAAGSPSRYDNILTCSFASSKPLTKKDCDENGDLVIATIYLEVSREITATTLTAGSSYFYDDDEVTYVEEYTLDLDDEFFFMYGDADNNRVISAADARYVLRVAAKLETINDELTFKRCDVNKDGKITAADARLILRAAAKLITSFDDEI